MELGFPIRQRPGPLQSVSLTSNEVWEVGPVSPGPIVVWEDNPPTTQIPTTSTRYLRYKKLIFRKKALTYGP